MIHAELDIRHTRKHMPTRRVALAGMHLPTAGSADGLVLVDAVLRTFLPRIDPEQRSTLNRVISQARAGELQIPGISLRYRLQIDQHGLDRSLHRIVEEVVPGFEQLPEGQRPVQRVIELDTHGPADPQVLGVVLAANAMPPMARQAMFVVIERALRALHQPPLGYHLRFLEDGVARDAPPIAGRGGAVYDDGARWANVAPEERWAMEVLGLRPEMRIERSDVQQRFRRLLRMAHPDQGAEDAGAAERIAELTEAREILLIARRFEAQR